MDDEKTIKRKPVRIEHIMLVLEGDLPPDHPEVERVRKFIDRYKRKDSDYKGSKGLQGLIKEFLAKYPKPEKKNPGKGRRGHVADVFAKLEARYSNKYS